MSSKSAIRRPRPLRPGDSGYFDHLLSLGHEDRCLQDSWTRAMNVEIPTHSLVALTSDTNPVFTLIERARSAHACEYFQNSTSLLSAFQNNCNVVSTNLVDMSTKETWSYPKVLTELSRRALVKPTPIFTGGPDSATASADRFNVDQRWSSGYFDRAAWSQSQQESEFSSWNSQIKLSHEGENKIVFADPLGSFYRSFKPTPHKIQTSRVYRCVFDGCRKKFSRKEELTRHTKTHSEERAFQCDICKRKFGRKDHWKKHVLTHADLAKRRRYVCPETSCGKRYTRSDALSRHRNAAHGTAPPFLHQ